MLLPYIVFLTYWNLSFFYLKYLYNKIILKLYDKTTFNSVFVYKFCCKNLIDLASENHLKNCYLRWNKKKNSDKIDFAYIQPNLS